MIYKPKNEKSAAWYDEAMAGEMYSKPPDRCSYIKLWRWALNNIKRKNNHIVELGCGTGQFAQLSSEEGHGHHYVKGLDFSPKNVERCVNRMTEFFGEASRIYNEKVFKVVNILDYVPNYGPNYTFVSLEVLEHIKDDIGLLNNFIGKHMLISVPSYGAPSHVRWFKNAGEVFERYGKYNITEMQIFRQGLGSQNEERWIYGVELNG